MNKTQNMQVAETILNQLGGNMFLLMTGSKDLMAGAGSQDLSLSFTVGSNEKRISKCRIVLNPSDTYTVSFYKGRGVNMKKQAEFSDIYNDNLREIFTAQTGLYLTF
jgi:hypothetical protein